MLDELQEPDVFVSDDNGLAGGQNWPPTAVLDLKCLRIQANSWQFLLKSLTGI